jgi:hypothetical protein
MFAINHAATALIFKRRFEDVSLVALLLSVQAMEFAWVVLNYLGVEHITTTRQLPSTAPTYGRTLACGFRVRCAPLCRCRPL